MKPGELLPDYYVSCAMCSKGEHVGEYKRTPAQRAARMLGYRRVTGVGYLCRACWREREALRKKAKHGESA